MPVPQRHNLNALIVGTGEFRFCKDATSAADARTKGYRDFGNIVAYTLETDSKMEEHEGSYRGKKIVDRKFSTSEKLEYMLTVDEHKKSNLMLLFMASAGTDLTQAAQVASQGDALEFTSPIPSVSDRWYNVYKSDARITNLTALEIASEAQIAVTYSTGTHLFTETSHGRIAGDPVVLGGTAVPTGFTAGTVYYVISVLTDTYALAATVGGASILGSTTGTAVKVQSVLVKDEDYRQDLLLGSVQFITAQTANVIPILSAPAIDDSDDAGFMKGLIPMEETEQVGYGEVICYDQNDDNQVVYRHQEFSCIVTAEKSKAVDGKKVTEFDIKVSVTKDPGTLFVREDEPTDSDTV